MPPGSGPQLRGPNLQHGGQPPGNANPAGARPPFGPRGFPGQAPPFAPQPQPGPQSSYSARPVQMPQPQQQFNRRPDSDEKINPSAMPRPRPRPDAPVVSALVRLTIDLLSQRCTDCNRKCEVAQMNSAWIPLGLSSCSQCIMSLDR